MTLEIDRLFDTSEHESRRPLSPADQRVVEAPFPERRTENGELLPLFVLKITQPALHAALDYLSRHTPEVAGILVGPANDDLLVTDFFPDKTGNGTPVSFTLGVAELNRTLRRLKRAGLNCKGIAHSHPAGFTAPSFGDLAYLRQMFALPQNAAAGSFYLPIVCRGRLYPYVFSAGHVWHAELILV